MYSFFGLMIIVSFCDFGFIKQNFFFLKTTTGRGVFDVFCSFMFLITGSVSISGYIMMGVLMVCGIFFIVIGMASKEDPAGADFDSKSL